MSLLDTMKKIAAETNDVQVPAAFLFGTVTASDPLTIRVDGRFDLSGDAIVLPKEFRGGLSPTHTHTVDPHGHTVARHGTEPTGEGPHVHGVSPLFTETTGLVTAEQTETYRGLAVGDKVVLLRNQGGQSFLVLGRV